MVDHYWYSFPDAYDDSDTFKIGNGLPIEIKVKTATIRKKQGMDFFF